MNMYFSLVFACVFDSLDIVECLLVNFCFCLSLLAKVRSFMSRHILSVVRVSVMSLSLRN